MERAIVSFHCDTEGDWVAHLECGHRQHVRHRPPFQVRPWTQDVQARESKVGLPLDCPLCDRAELPDDLDPARTLSWDQDTIPAALFRTHRVGRTAWAVVRVVSGRIRFVFCEAPNTGRLLEAGATQAIPPGIPHRLESVGDVQLQIEFFAIPGATSST